MTRRRVVVVAVGVALAAAGLAVGAALRADRLPSSVWVQVRTKSIGEHSDLICDLPGGAPLGAEWHSSRTCGFQTFPECVRFDRGATPASIAWLSRLLGISRNRWIEYKPANDWDRSDVGSWLEYVRDHG